MTYLFVFSMLQTYFPLHNSISRMSLVGEFIETNLRSNVSHATLGNIQSGLSATEDLLSNLSHLRDLNKIDVIHNIATTIENYMRLKQDILAFVEDCSKTSFMGWAQATFGTEGMAIKAVENQHLGFKRMLVNLTKRVFILGSDADEDMQLRQYREVLKKIKEMETVGKNVGQQLLTQSSRLSLKFQQHMQAFEQKIKEFNHCVDKVVVKVLAYTKKMQEQLAGILAMNQQPFDNFTGNSSPFRQPTHSQSITQQPLNYSQPQKSHQRLREPETPMMEINDGAEQAGSYIPSRHNSRFFNPYPHFGRELYPEDTYNTIDDFYRQKSTLQSFIPTNDVTVRDYYD